MYIEMYAGVQPSPQPITPEGSLMPICKSSVTSSEKSAKWVLPQFAGEKTEAQRGRPTSKAMWLGSGVA